MSSSERKQQQQLSPAVDFGAGLLGGIASTYIYGALYR